MLCALFVDGMVWGNFLWKSSRLPPNFKPLTDKNKVVSASLCCVV
jgi:hypothetical protein